MKRQIVALGGGGFSNDPEEPDGQRLDQVILDATGKAQPRICFIGTAGGDAESNTLRFYQAFVGRAEPHDLNLFWRSRHPGLRDFILGMDAVYVGGGSTLNLLAIWRAHGLDAILARGVAGRSRARRDERRDGLLVRMAGHRRLPRRRAAGYSRTRAPARQRLLPLRRPDAPGGLPRARQGRNRRRPRRRGRRRADLRGHRAARGRHLNATGPRLPGRSGRRAREFLPGSSDRGYPGSRPSFSGSPIRSIATMRPCATVNPATIGV